MNCGGVDNGGVVDVFDDEWDLFGCIVEGFDGECVYFGVVGI